MGKTETILFLAVILLIVPIVSAYDTHEKDTPFEVVITSNNASGCNVSYIQYPDGTKIIYEKEMTKQGNTFNATFNSKNYSSVGVVCHGIVCLDAANNVETGSVCKEVTSTGLDLGESGITASIILLGILALAFMFMIIGFKLSDNPKLIPLSFFFVILSIILGIYSLHLGWSFSSDIIQYDSLSSTAEVMYVTILWLVIGVGVIFSALMLIAFISELGKMAKTRKFGEDFDPLTNTY